MKKLIVMMLMIAVLQGKWIVGGQDNPDAEPDGFRGLKWGTPLSKVKDEMELYKKDFSTYNYTGKIGEWYYRKNEYPYTQIGSVKIQVYYFFFDGKLVHINILTYSTWYDDLMIFKTLVFEKFGTGALSGDGNYVWNGEKTMMFLYPFKGSLMMFDKEFFEKFNEIRKQKTKEEW